MINSKKHLFNPFSVTANICFILLFMVLGQAAQAQCFQWVEHLSGIEQIGCTTVTVTPQGDTGGSYFCGIGPYFLGQIQPLNSFTITFSPPVSGVTIDLSAVTNVNSNTEEVSFEVNGSFYPITVPGNTIPCQPPCIILPSGRIGAPSGTPGCSWGAININEPISTIKVENVIVSGSPDGLTFNLRFCESCCATDAGVLSGSSVNVCLPNPAAFSPATQTNLEPGDLLQYVLYTNANDPEGSILATSNTPNFDFNPATMQTGVTYYVAAVAGNEVNGNVDLTDPCLDISNVIEVEWNPFPTVGFSVASPEVCAGDCLTFNVTFTGTPPFILTYDSPVSGEQTQTFTTNTGTLQICPPAGTPPGTVTLSALIVSDEYCVCEP